jgi:hypothetical protein
LVEEIDFVVGHEDFERQDKQLSVAISILHLMQASHAVLRALTIDRLDHLVDCDLSRPKVYLLFTNAVADLKITTFACCC